MILGDSTSATYGVEAEMYPFHLVNRCQWPANCRFVSCAQPGVTAADAAVFFQRHRRDCAPLLAVILNVGTCDSVAAELRKGRLSQGKRLRQWVRKMSGRPYRRHPLQNRLHRREWDPFFKPALEKPESPSDFAYNLRSIVACCHRQKIPVVMIQPTGHLDFPAGIGKGNFDFYRHINVDEPSATGLETPDPKFCEALELQARRNFNDAKKHYRALLEEIGPMSGHPEFPLICVHNYAVCCAECGETAEARYLFELLLKESRVRQEVVLFNLAQLARLNGEDAIAHSMLMKAYETDLSMYRIRHPYREKIATIAAEFSNITRLIDQQALVSDEEFIDHCHPMPMAQRRLANAVAKEMNNLGIVGSEPAHIENRLYNPELALGDTNDFHSYFKTRAPYSQRQIAAWVVALQNSLDENGDLTQAAMEDMPFELRRAVGQHLQHPCFPLARDLLRWGPELPGDIGRFPELFLVRHVIPFLKIHQSESSLKDRFDRQLALLRPAERLLSLLPIDMLPSEDSPLKNDLFRETTYPLRVLQAVQHSLIRHTRGGNRIAARLKGTIYWYFRESLRFGAHSRISMRYDRIDLEFAAEALAIVGVIDQHQDCRHQTSIIELIAQLQELTRIHEQFCSRFDTGVDNRPLLTDYDQALSIAGSRIASIVLPLTVSN